MSCRRREQEEGRREENPAPSVDAERRCRNLDAWMRVQAAVMLYRSLQGALFRSARMQMGQEFVVEAR